MKRHRNAARARRVCWDTHRQHDHMGHFMPCGKCGIRIDPVRMKWQCDHYPIKWTDGGEDVPENVRPLCEPCFETVNPEDWKQISHGKRAGARHFGIKDRRPWR